jgi:hypothetical protein
MQASGLGAKYKNIVYYYASIFVFMQTKQFAPLRNAKVFMY